MVGLVKECDMYSSFTMSRLEEQLVWNKAAIRKKRLHILYEIMCLLFSALVGINVIAAAIYGYSNPELTQVQVVLAWAEWLIPLRWWF